MDCCGATGGGWWDDGRYVDCGVVWCDVVRWCVCVWCGTLCVVVQVCVTCSAVAVVVRAEMAKSLVRWW